MTDIMLHQVVFVTYLIPNVFSTSFKAYLFLLPYVPCPFFLSMRASAMGAIRELWINSVFGSGADESTTGPVFLIKHRCPSSASTSPLESLALGHGSLHSPICVHKCDISRSAIGSLLLPELSSSSLTTSIVRLFSSVSIVGYRWWTVWKILGIAMAIFCIGRSLTPLHGFKCCLLGLPTWLSY